LFFFGAHGVYLAWEVKVWVYRPWKVEELTDVKVGGVAKADATNNSRSRNALRAIT
jgi:hypothetical protein